MANKVTIPRPKKSKETIIIDTIFACLSLAEVLIHTYDIKSILPNGKIDQKGERRKALRKAVSGMLDVKMCFNAFDEDLLTAVDGHWDQWDFFLARVNGLASILFAADGVLDSHKELDAHEKLIEKIKAHGRLTPEVEAMVDFHTQRMRMIQNKLYNIKKRNESKDC
jgi:hypothetical protein